MAAGTVGTDRMNTVARVEPTSLRVTTDNAFQVIWSATANLTAGINLTNETVPAQGQSFAATLESAFRKLGGAICEWIAPTVRTRMVANRNVGNMNLPAVMVAVSTEGSSVIDGTIVPIAAMN